MTCRAGKKNLKKNFGEIFKNNTCGLIMLWAHAIILCSENVKKSYKKIRSNLINLINQIFYDHKKINLFLVCSVIIKNISSKADQIIGI